MQKNSKIHTVISADESQKQYDPEFWLDEYQVRPYLKQISDDDLVKRYHSLIFNRDHLLASWYFNHIGFYDSKSFLSANFWHKKIHQTEQEFSERGLSISVVKQKPLIPLPDAQFASDNVGLTRYGKMEHMQQFFEEKLRICPARDYEKDTLTAAQRDIECQKSFYTEGSKVTITLPNGKTSRPIGPMTYSSNSTGYHFCSFAQEINLNLFEPFEADAMVVIDHRDEFIARILSVTESYLPACEWVDMPVEYFDPYDRQVQMPFDATLHKDFKYAYQQEYRLAWRDQRLGHEPQFLQLGSLKDIARLFIINRDTNRLEQVA